MPTEDDHTENERILDAINATIENRASSDQQYYMIGTRQLHRIPIAELRILRSTYITAVRRFLFQTGAIKRVEVSR